MTKAELLKQLADLPNDCRVYIDPMGLPPVMEPDDYPLVEIGRAEIMEAADSVDGPIAVVRTRDQDAAMGKPITLDDVLDDSSLREEFFASKLRQLREKQRAKHQQID